MSGNDKKKDKPDSYFSIRRRRSRRYMKIIAAIVIPIIAIGTISGLLYTPPKSIAPTIDGIECNASERTTYHVHAHLDIFVDGQPYAVPGQIGIVGGSKCFYWIHTHDLSGTIHVESPDTRSFTLGQFFDIWNQTLTDQQVLIYTATDTKPLKLYFNGNKVDSHFRDIILNSHDEIAIVYGPTSSNFIPPKSYAFPNGL